MDERELETLFKGAPGDAPPPTFGTDEVLAASARARARHRMRVVTGGALAALVLAGGGLFGMLGSDLLGGGGSPDSGALSADSRTGQPDEGVVRPSSGGPGSGPAATGMQGPEAADKDSKLEAARTPGCETVDRELAVALAGELPATPQGDAVGGKLPCAPGGNAGYLVRERGVDVWISAAYFPKGGQPRLAYDRREQLVEARAADGGLIVVLRTPAGGREETADTRSVDTDDLQRIADALAADR